MPRLAPCFLHLVASVILALILAIGMAEAGIFQTPAGGWGIDRPAPAPAETPRGAGRP